MAFTTEDFLTGLGIFGIIAAVVLVVVEAVGAGYLTAVVFDKKKMSELTEVELNLTRFVMVMFWVGLAMALYSLGPKVMNLVGGSKPQLYYF